MRAFLFCFENGWVNNDLKLHLGYIWAPANYSKHRSLTWVFLWSQNVKSMILPNLGSGSASRGQHTPYFQKINFGIVRCVWAARRAEAHWFLTFVGCFWSLHTHDGVLLHDPLGGTWGVVIWRLDTLYYCIPNQSLSQVLDFIWP